MFASCAVACARACRWAAGPGLLLRLALGLWLLALAAHTASAQAPPPGPPDKRIALVIGNARYPKAPLVNPENDARLVAANLRKLGFEVNEQRNLPVLQFRRVLREFAKQVQQDDAIAVLYYAGHGLQIDGRNYLLPVDVNLRDQEEVKDESVDIDELFLSRIDKVGSFPRIVILDACRNNPFARKTRNIRASGGLAEMGARGTLIAFASAPGAAAEDGPDGGNSVYTQSLAEEMMVPGVEVEQMFKNVRVKVLRDTAGRQLPWVNTSLTSNFSFNPGGRRPSAALARRPADARPQAEPEPAPAPPRSKDAVPKDIETALAMARREQSIAPAPAHAPASPSAPAPAPAAAPSSAAGTASRPSPQPAATQLAMQAPPPGPPLPPPSPTRAFLGRDEVQQLLVGKSHSLQELAGGGVMRWDLRSGGTLYYNSQSPGLGGVNGSGRWTLKDDGSLCVTFTTPPPMQPAQARRPDNGCWHFFRDGDRLLRASAAAPQAPAEAEVVKIQ